MVLTCRWFLQGSSSLEIVIIEYSLIHYRVHPDAQGVPLPQAGEGSVRMSPFSSIFVANYGKLINRILGNTT